MFQVLKRKLEFIIENRQLVSNEVFHYNVAMASTKFSYLRASDKNIHQNSVV